MKEVKKGGVVYYVPHDCAIYERDFGVVTEIDKEKEHFDILSLKDGLKNERRFPLLYFKKKIFTNKEEADKMAVLRGEK